MLKVVEERVVGEEGLVAQQLLDEIARRGVVMASKLDLSLSDRAVQIA
jgi:hypothetical protein